jgi:hypothetical protein
MKGTVALLARRQCRAEIPESPQANHRQPYNKGFAG